MRVLNQMDRFSLSKEVAVDVLGDQAGQFAQSMDDMVAKHNQYIRNEGTDLPEVEEWQWTPLR